MYKEIIKPLDTKTLRHKEIKNNFHFVSSCLGGKKLRFCSFLGLISIFTLPVTGYLIPLFIISSNSFLSFSDTYSPAGINL